MVAAVLQASSAPAASLVADPSPAPVEEPEPVSDEAGDDVEPVPAPRKGPIIKKKVVAPKK